MAIDFRTYRIDDINRNLRQMRIRPLDVMVAGATGVGKSTTLNAFFQKTVAVVGNGPDPKTMDVGDYALNDVFRIWDTPGLGDGYEADQRHQEKIVHLLQRMYRSHDWTYGFIDMVLVILDASVRDMGTVRTLLEHTIIPNMPIDRILVVMNQADYALKGHHWNYDTNTLDKELMTFLDQKAASVQRRIWEDTGAIISQPVCYSAEYMWNVQKVFDFIINNMPHERRSLRP